MQLVVQRLPDLASEHIHQILRRSLLHTGEAAEALDEKAAPFLADAGHERASTP